MVDIASLSDDDLRNQLQDYGVKVGPIVSSTRLFYEKRLGKLIECGGVLPPPPEPDSEEEDEDEEDEEVQWNYRQEPVMSTPLSQPHSRTYQATAGYTPITQQRRASPTRATTATHRTVTSSTTHQTRQTSGSVPDKKTAKKSGGMALWIKLLFVIIVAMLVYLVIINVNPAALNKIPMSLGNEDV